MLIAAIICYALVYVLSVGGAILITRNYYLNRIETILDEHFEETIEAKFIPVKVEKEVPAYDPWMLPSDNKPYQRKH